MSIFYISEAHEYKSDLFYIYTCTLQENPRWRSNEKSVYKKHPNQEIKHENKKNPHNREVKGTNTKICNHAKM